MSAREAWETARSLWPGIHLPAEEFETFLAGRSYESEHLGELYLACACARADRVALEAFEREYFPDIAKAVSRARKAPGLDDVRQMIREKLFVASSETAPRILDYEGKGSLRNWLRVIVARLLLNAATRTKQDEPLDETILEKLEAGRSDPELEHFKRTYAAEFKTAFSTSVTRLSPAERNLLRFAFCEAMTVDEIGRLEGVHRATAARHVRAAHKKLTQGIYEELAVQLGVATREVGSILALVSSRMTITLERYLGS